MNDPRITKLRAAYTRFINQFNDVHEANKDDLEAQSSLTRDVLVKFILKVDKTINEVK